MPNKKPIYTYMTCGMVFRSSRIIRNVVVRCQKRDGVMEDVIFSKHATHKQAYKEKERLESLERRGLIHLFEGWFYIADVEVL